MKKTFYRVGTDSKEGLWYNQDGEFTGLIHTEFKWVNASNLIMPFEQELVGYISVADSLQHLYQWFSEDELIKLRKIGFKIFEYEATDYKFYDLYKHNVICQKTSVITGLL
jgi:hypothetical protein